MSGTVCGGRGTQCCGKPHAHTPPPRALSHLVHGAAGRVHLHADVHAWRKGGGGGELKGDARVDAAVEGGVGPDHVKLQAARRHGVERERGAAGHDARVVSQAPVVVRAVRPLCARRAARVDDAVGHQLLDGGWWGAQRAWGWGVGVGAGASLNAPTPPRRQQACSSPSAWPGTSASSATANSRWVPILRAPAGMAAVGWWREGEPHRKQQRVLMKTSSAPYRAPPTVNSKVRGGVLAGRAQRWRGGRTELPSALTRQGSALPQCSGAH